MKTMNKTLALVALVGASSAFAMDADFNTIDADQSGAISMEEASKYPELMSQFKELDTDVNGELSQEEFDKAQ